jgi:hypothetical protein
MPRPRSTRDVVGREPCYRVDKPRASRKTPPPGTPLRSSGASGARAQTAQFPSHQGDSSGAPIASRGSGRASSPLGPRCVVGGSGWRLSKHVAGNAKRRQSESKVASCPNRRFSRGQHRAPARWSEPPARHRGSRGIGVQDRDAPRIAMRSSPRARGSITHPPRDPRPCHAGLHLWFSSAWRSRPCSRPFRLTSTGQARAGRRRLPSVLRGERPRTSSPES